MLRVTCASRRVDVVIDPYGVLRNVVWRCLVGEIAGCEMKKAPSGSGVPGRMGRLGGRSGGGLAGEEDDLPVGGLFAERLHGLLAALGVEAEQGVVKDHRRFGENEIADGQA